VGSAALFMSAKGSFASFGLSSTHFRSAPISRHFQYPSACLKGAKLGHDANKLIRRPQKKKPPRRRLFNTGRCGVGQRFSRVYSRPTQPTCAPDRALPLTLKRALIEQAERLYYPFGNQPVCSLYTAQEMIRSGWLVLREDGRYEITPDGQRAAEVSEHA
jgi:hypothetical protein